MTFELPPIAILLAVLLVVGIAAVYDMRWRRIPNWVVLTGILLGIGSNTFLFEWAGLRFSLLGLGLAFVVYFPLYLLRGMGAGDVKLMASVGAMVGWANWIGIFIITAIVGGVAAVAFLLRRNRLIYGLSNVGYMVGELASLKAPYARNEALDISSARSMKLPHGVFIALGSLIFLGAAWMWAPR